MNEPWFGPLLTAVTTTFAALLGWFAGRRRIAADTDTSIVTGANLAVETLMQALNEMKAQVESLKTELDTTRAALDDARTEVASLRSELEDIYHERQTHRVD